MSGREELSEKSLELMVMNDRRGKKYLNKNKRQHLYQIGIISLDLIRRAWWRNVLFHMKSKVLTLKWAKRNVAWYSSLIHHECLLSVIFIYKGSTSFDGPNLITLELQA